MKLFKSYIFLFIVAVSVFVLPTLATVLGIDLGSELIKVAAVAPGRSFEIVLDESSKRSHPSLVVFDQDVRQYGTTAFSLVARRPLKSLQQFTRLLGKPANGTNMKAQMARHYLFSTLVNDDTRGVFRYESPYLELVSEPSTSEDKKEKEKEKEEDDKDKGYTLTAKSYSVEEITAMKLQHIKEIAARGTGTDAVDCIITVPHFWTHKERRALLDAGQLAGLNVFALINENTAAAIQYAITMDYQQSGLSTNYIFFNMGATSVQVSVIRFFSREEKVSKVSSQVKFTAGFEVLGQGWDETLGGSDFDLLIVDILLNKAKVMLQQKKVEQSAIDALTNNPKIMTRLKLEAQKVKKVLTANKETPVNIEGLYGDYDFRGLVTREELYSAAVNLFSRVNPPIDMALQRANIDKDEVEGIVLLGGGTRIPRIRELLAEYLRGKPLKENLNADEAPAMGAAFRAANMSSTFRVRSILMEDITSFPVGVRLKNLNPTTEEDKQYAKRGSLFSMNNRLRRRRAVTMKHSQDLHVNVFYEQEAILPLDTSHNLGSYEVTGLTDAVKKYSLPDFNVTDAPKVSLSFSLDDSGLVDLVQATATFVEVYTDVKKKTISSQSQKKDKEETEKEKDKNNQEKETEKETKKENENEKEKKEETKKEENDQNDIKKPNSQENENTLNTIEKKENNTQDFQEELVTKERKHRVVLTILRHPPIDVKPYDSKAFEGSRKVLLELEERDRAVIEAANSQNALESYIYKSRDILNSDQFVEKVSTEEIREQILNELSLAENWMMEVTEKNAGIFKRKLRELKKLTDPIFTKAEELEQRPKIIEKATSTIQKLYESFEILKKNYTWIFANETETLYNATKNFEEWLNTKIEQQSNKPLTEDPAFTVRDVENRMWVALDIAQRLMAKRPPPDFFKKKRQEEREKQTNATKANGTETSENSTEGNNEDSYTIPKESEDGPSGEKKEEKADGSEKNDL